MKKPFISLLSTLVLGGAAVTGLGAAPASAAEQRPATTDVDFAGTVALSNCSGSVVRAPGSADTDPALVLSNGHCLETGMPGAGDVIVDQPSSRTFSLLNASGQSAGTLTASKMAYATMTDTDVSLYQLSASYADIKRQYGIDALELADSHPSQGTAIKVVSGYWQRMYSCAVDGFAHEVHEGDWTWKDSVRYTAPCDVIGGTSGSPVVDADSGKVIAVNNTINESGQECTLNNPCEVDEQGKVTVRPGIGYAQETYLITRCLGAGNEIDLNQPDCVLPQPNSDRSPAIARR